MSVISSFFLISKRNCNQKQKLNLDCSCKLRKLNYKNRMINRN
nr:MAG TPA: hypothetical protein [Caudoviricetes sp.]